jgi:glutamine---fructose-6-phosphate transaminase (isomerizing)
MDVNPNTSGYPVTGRNPYLSDVLDQPRALTAVLDSSSEIVPLVRDVDLASRPRVILSGMGSSHYATHALWASLVKLGVAAWWVDTAQLLDVVDDLVVPGCVLWLTSQSGESAETVALLGRVSSPDVHVVGVTNDQGSTLGRAADTRLDLRVGDEATVSTKSYVNTLAVARLVAAQLDGTLDQAQQSLRLTVDAAADYLIDIDERVARAGLFAMNRNLLVTGRGGAAASAQAAGLVIKEAAKIPAEGMSAGALRHGVIELAGPTLAVVFFDHGLGVHREQNVRLATDLTSVGTQVGWVASQPPTDSLQLPCPQVTGIDLAIRDALAFQTLSFALASRASVTAGSFAVASKVTDVL